MSILTHDEAKRLSQSSTDPLEVIRNVENAVIAKLAVSQNALKDEIRLIWKPKCDALRQQLEAAQAENAQSRIDFKEMVIERNAALARLAEIEAQNLMARQIILEHGEGVVGASPVEPSQAQPPAPSDTAITYMTGYSDGREWAAAPIPQQPSVPEGWKLVPIEPTEAMLEVGFFAENDVFDSAKTKRIHVWKDMLSAAPQPRETK